MIERAFIHVAGPPGVGKTALIEQLLRKELALALAVRGARSSKSVEMKESASKSDPELRRYRAAGALAAARVSFPASVDEFAFFETHLMQEYSEAVYVEGDCPLASADLSVFVAPAPTEGETLLRRETRSHTEEKAATLAEWKAITSSTESYARHLTKFLEQQFGPLAAAEDIARPNYVESARQASLEVLSKLENSGAPAPTRHWALGERYEGLQHGQLVVVNVRPGESRDRAEELCREIPRIRKDEAVHADILGILGSRVPVTAVVADLGRAEDAGTRKAIQRVKRTIRRITERR